MKTFSTAIFSCALSFIFKKVTGPTLLKTGSLGVGCTIDKSVKVTVSISDKESIKVNSKQINFPTVKQIANQLTNTPLSIQIESSLPLGYGFGVSGASALGTAFAINKLLRLKKKKKDLISIAHTSEIENGTGLGTVGTQTTKGFILKRSAGIPFKYTTLPFSNKKLFVIVISQLKSPDILKNKKMLTNLEKFADTALGEITSDKFITLERVIDISYEFVKNSNILNDERTIKIIEKIKNHGNSATMAILGNIVITTKKPNFPISYPIHELTIC